MHSKRDRPTIDCREELTADGLVLVGTVVAILVPVTLPGPQNTLSGGLALEHVDRAVVVAHGLVGIVSAVVDAVTKRGREGALLVIALELPLLALALRTGRGLVTSVGAVHFAIAPEGRDAQLLENRHDTGLLKLFVAL